MKEQIKTPEKELSNEEIDKLSDAEFKTLVIRMLTEMVEDGHKIKEEVKAVQSEIKKNIQGTNSEGKETGTQINGLEQDEEINIQKAQNEEASHFSEFLFPHSVLFERLFLPSGPDH